ncbi:LCP family protein [Occultella glacieicola]|uniref:LCP family protein n=1 Tax=Occultella glacieicola TaxID=2518684 RepID=UPI001404D4C7|nr:LCP family protein [Occultella glacieicola]
MRTAAVAVVGAFAFAATFGGTVYAQLQAEVDVIRVDDLINQPTDAEGAPVTPAPPADPNAGTALNILIIGSDSRADGAVDDGFDSVLADTHIVAHIAADRSRVELVSIPRDIMVQIPDCPTTSGETIHGWYGMYNAAFANGWLVGGDTETAVACDINLAQSATGLTIDGFVLVEMGGFIEMVDALGGVDICIPEAISAPKAHLFLDAGEQTLTGEQALGYARARVGVGDGSDPGRIERQQRLMSAMVAEVLSRNILADGPALYGMVNAALGSLTMSENLSSLTGMAGLALSLRSLSADDVTFLTTPYGAYAPDPNRLVWTSEVDEIWAAMAADEPILAGDEGTGNGASGAATPGADGTPTQAPSAEDAPLPDPDEGATQTPSEAGTAGASAEDLTVAC